MERSKNQLKTEKTSLSLSIRISLLFVTQIIVLIGYTLADYRIIFQAIAPIHIIVASLILFFDKSILNKQFIIFFILAFLIGFVSEVFGVKSGLLFGYYEYTDWLGFKLLSVPVVIGLLWASTAYACNQVSSKLFPHSKIIAITMSALLLVFLDYMMEPFAVSVNLWIWHLSVIPPFNYLSWFIVGFIVSIVYNYTLKDSENQVASYFIISEVLFFLVYQLLNGGFTLTPFD